MLRKIFIMTAILTAGAVSLAWSLTSHKEYAGMTVKECNACHASSGAAQNHDSLWVKDHRLTAEKYPNNCKDCHDQSYCLDCHTGGGIEADLHRSQSGPNYMPNSHRTDFREIHPIKALDDPRSCYRCHDSQEFCSACHAKFNPNDLRVLSHRKGFSDLQVTQGGPKHSLFTSSQCQTCHPNSVLPKFQWSAEHSREARKNLTSCQSCHSDGNVCLKCHSAVTGLKVNPHPRDWSKISGKYQRNSKTCIKCH